jgi:hypothetical protein
VLCYVPERDEFERAVQYLEHLYFPTATKALDTDIVSKKEFKAFVAKLRQRAAEGNPTDENGSTSA